jgi:transcription elongation factor GreA
MSSETTLSRQAFERLNQELEDLTTRGRIEVAATIEAARALGDLKENGDYHAAKDTQGKMEARIRQLQALLADAIIIDDVTLSTETVAQGLTVALKYVGDDDVLEYFVGSIEEKRNGVDILSPTSPLGQSVIGAHIGDLVAYDAPGGRLQVEIVDIRA